MPFSFFGRPKSKKAPDLRTLAEWLSGTDRNLVKRAMDGFTAVLLEELDKDGIVERLASRTDLAGNGADQIKGQVIRLMTGGGPGAVPREPLTRSQVAVAQRAYDEIRKRGCGELYGAGLAAALLNATAAWYGEYYDHSISVATHVIIDLDSQAGEAYRVRAFGRIVRGEYAEARDDLRKALSLTPSLGGATEPLAAMEGLLS